MLGPRTRISPSSAILDRKSTRLNSSHGSISYAVFCLKKKNKTLYCTYCNYPHPVHSFNMCTSAVVRLLAWCFRLCLIQIQQCERTKKLFICGVRERQREATSGVLACRGGS